MSSARPSPVTKRIEERGGGGGGGSLTRLVKLLAPKKGEKGCGEELSKAPNHSFLLLRWFLLLTRKEEKGIASKPVSSPRKDEGLISSLSTIAYIFPFFRLWLLSAIFICHESTIDMNGVQSLGKTTWTIKPRPCPPSVPPSGRWGKRVQMTEIRFVGRVGVLKHSRRPS